MLQLGPAEPNKEILEYIYINQRDKVLLYSTGDSVQYLLGVITVNNNAKNSYVCAYINIYMYKYICVCIRVCLGLLR